MMTGTCFCVLCSVTAAQFQLPYRLCCASFHENWPVSSAGSSCPILCVTVAKNVLNKSAVVVGM